MDGCTWCASSKHQRADCDKGPCNYCGLKSCGALAPKGKCKVKHCLGDGTNALGQKLSKHTVDRIYRTRQKMQSAAQAEESAVSGESSESSADEAECGELTYEAATCVSCEPDAPQRERRSRRMRDTYSSLSARTARADAAERAAACYRQIASSDRRELIPPAPDCLLESALPDQPAADAVISGGDAAEGAPADGAIRLVGVDDAQRHGCRRRSLRHREDSAPNLDSDPGANAPAAYVLRSVLSALAAAR